jgi:putative transposase
LILKLARETGWGYTRILGELKKLGTNSVSRNTVKNILKANGFDTGPRRGPGTWDEFLKIHAATLWQCDFFSKKVLTPKGFRDLFVLVFLHVGTRRLIVSPATYHPNGAWIEAQAATFRRQTKASGLKAEILYHDRDSKFTQAFDQALSTAGIEVKHAPIRSPNTVAFIERFVQTIQQECLDHFVVFGESHMNHLCREFVEHYHTERPHQGKENELLRPPRQPKQRAAAEAQSISLREVRCQQRLGGLLKHYYRAAA